MVFLYNKKLIEIQWINDKIFSLYSFFEYIAKIEFSYVTRNQERGKNCQWQIRNIKDKIVSLYSSYILQKSALYEWTEENNICQW